MTNPELTVQPVEPQTLAERREVLVSGATFEAIRREALRRGCSMERVIVEMVRKAEGK
jgi:hypothetical protein